MRSKIAVAIGIGLVAVAVGISALAVKPPLKCIQVNSSGSFNCKDAGNFDSTCATATCPAGYTLTGGGGACAAGDRKVKSLFPVCHRVNSQSPVNSRVSHHNQTPSAANSNSAVVVGGGRRGA